MHTPVSKTTISTPPKRLVEVKSLLHTDCRAAGKRRGLLTSKHKVRKKDGSYTNKSCRTLPTVPHKCKAVVLPWLIDDVGHVEEGCGSFGAGAGVLGVGCRAEGDYRQACCLLLMIFADWLVTSVNGCALRQHHLSYLHICTVHISQSAHSGKGKSPQQLLSAIPFQHIFSCCPCRCFPVRCTSVCDAVQRKIT